MNKINKLSLFINTIRYLRCKQIYYRLFYFIKEKFKGLLGLKYNFSRNSNAKNLMLLNSIELLEDGMDNYEFKFINLSKKFSDKIDWNYSDYGKLWTYNLTYFEFLNRKESVKHGLELISAFIENIVIIRDGLDSYPISLRGINWIKFLVCNNVNNKIINDSLYAQYYILLNKLEYHLLGNHLLENGFSLLFGAYYFEDLTLYERAKEILEVELEEQILADGAHFELSPMYHQIILFRLLDCINLITNNNWRGKELLRLFLQKAGIMLSWLEEMTFRNGEIPLFNDSTNFIAPNSKSLFKYAKLMSVKANRTRLNESGYRKYRNDNYEMIVDVGKIGPDYLTGHSHSDTFNFELYINDKPVIVDTGVSTYENTHTRFAQRSTMAHNTVIIENFNQSEVWSSFRVARRAYVDIIDEGDDFIEVVHDGYKRIGAWHKRRFESFEREIKIIDFVESRKKYLCRAFFHFHPDECIKKKNNRIITSDLEIQFKGNTELDVKDYNYAPEFNKLIKSKCVVAFFNTNTTLKTILRKR